MEELPVEIIENILKSRKLQIEDVLNFSTTCRYFRDIVVNSNAVWKHKFCDKWPNLFHLFDSNFNNYYNEIRYIYHLKEKTRKMLEQMPPRFYKRYEISDSDLEQWSVLLNEREHVYDYLVHDLMEIVNTHVPIKSIEVVPLKNNCVSPVNQLLTTLRLFSTGGHLDAVGDFAGMHLSTVSRIIVRVSEALDGLSRNYISMPSDNVNIRTTQPKFYDIASFPRIIGAIDCTHCKIIFPGGEYSEIFRNRKSYFSINAQFVCDVNLTILNVIARWSESSHDATIFSNSLLRQHFETNQYPNCLLLGDNGYPNKTYLLTPLLNPMTAAERRYNASHIQTRNVIERLFGVLKRRFPILSYGCRLKVDTFLTIIIACSVLHNIALQWGDQEAPPLPDELGEHIFTHLVLNGQIPDVNIEAGDDMAGSTRRTLISDYFQQVEL